MSGVLQRSAGGFAGAEGLILPVRRSHQGSAPATFLMVLCHGYGGNAAQLGDLSAAAGAAFPQAAIYRPDAPTLCPFSLRGALAGSRGRQWFPLSRPLPSCSPEAEEAAAALNRQVDAKLARLGLEKDAVWFIGFSQGAMVSLLAGLTRSVAPRGIIGLAGALLAPAEDFVPRCRPPVLLVHGAEDSVVPARHSAAAALRLKAARIDVRLVFLPLLDHAIVDAAAPYVSAFIAERMR